MTIPNVSLTELDGALGILPGSTDSYLAVVGVSSAGTIAAPAAFARITDLVAAFGYGPMVEAAAHHIRSTGRPVVVVRTGSATAASSTAVVFTGTGTSTGTVNATLAPTDDFECVVRIIAGGTRGVAGVTYQVSVDGGRTYSDTIALATGTSITFPAALNAGTITLDLGAGTFVAGDIYAFRVSAKMFNATEITAALTALQNWVGAWEMVEIVGALDATLYAAVDAAIVAMRAVGKRRLWIGNTRVPNVGESESAYKTALDAIFASLATKHGVLCAGAVKHTSAVSGRRYKRPVSFVVASLEASLSQEQNAANVVNPGALPNIAIKDSYGNPDEHDELVNPGLDDSRFYVLRSWNGRQGTYVNLPRLFSPSGSDFRLVTHRRVMNVAEDVLQSYLEERLNKPVGVNGRTGYILESEAREIEAGANRRLEAALLAKPKASAATFTLSRTDNVQSTRQLTGQARIVPLAYAEAIVADIGFTNPALTVVSA